MTKPATTMDPLAGLTIGEIPIAGSKRRSLAIQIQGQLYRIGRIPANRAFVIIRNNLRLLYVAPEYRNYRYAARKVFGPGAGRLDIDHLLGRKLTQSHGYWYTLMVRLHPVVNRSHGWLEQPEALAPAINLDKFCYTDDRVFQKILGQRSALLQPELRQKGYQVVRENKRPLKISEARKVRFALGMNGPGIDLTGLTPIEC